jgi:hypothetical protein
MKQAFEQHIKSYIQALVGKGYLDNPGSTTSQEYEQQLRDGIYHVQLHPMFGTIDEKSWDPLFIKSGKAFGQDQATFLFNYIFRNNEKSLRLASFTISLSQELFEVVKVHSPESIPTAQNAYDQVKGTQLKCRPAPYIGIVNAKKTEYGRKF